MTLRLDEHDHAALLAMTIPGENRTDAIRRAIREAVPPRDVLLWCSKPPLFAQPVSRGPMNLLAAEAQGSALLRQGWDVRVEVVDARPVPPVVEDDGEPECEVCSGLGEDHDEDCPRFAGEE